MRTVGSSIFNFSDEFADPISLGVEVGGDSYDISGVWSVSFLAEVFINARDSIFTEG